MGNIELQQSMLFLLLLLVSSKFRTANSNAVIPQDNVVVAFLSPPITNYWLLPQQMLKPDNAREHVPLIATEVTPLDSKYEQEDTIRVRIWRSLASGKEFSLKKLGVVVGEGQKGDLKAHLKHVEKQAKTLKNKNIDWRRRRGLPVDNIKKTNKLRIKTRRGEKNEVYVRLG